MMWAACSALRRRPPWSGRTLLGLGRASASGCRLLLAAAAAGSCSVLQLAAQTAVQTEQHGAARRLLGSLSSYLAQELLQKAAEPGRAGAVRVLLQAGATPTLGVLCTAVRSADLLTLQALLQAAEERGARLQALPAVQQQAVELPHGVR
ncbi:hypothetical protein ABPG75_007267 [Micractinium tetrahymenae]